VIVSNRGPLAFHLDHDGEPVAGNVAGGLAGSLRPLVEGSGATWVACVLGDADRRAAAGGLMVEEGLQIELLDPDADVYRMAYDLVSNATLWFCHHRLFDAARRPRSDSHWAESWEAYRQYNRMFAERVAELAPDGGRVLVQDYHLTLVGSELSRLRPDLRSVHFTHTPFGDPSDLRMLPTQVADELLEGLAGFRSCGFHTDRWAAAYRTCQRELGPARYRQGPDAPTFASPQRGDAERVGAGTDPRQGVSAPGAVGAPPTPGAGGVAAAGGGVRGGMTD
jgi:trehalose 6-phosphate synthase